jgi:hypothetical protein
MLLVSNTHLLPTPIPPFPPHPTIPPFSTPSLPPRTSSYLLGSIDFGSQIPLLSFNLSFLLPKKDVDFRETRVALPTAHGISNFLKRRHSVPETQQDLRAMHEAQQTSPRKGRTSPKEGIIQRIFSRQKKNTTPVVGIAFPAAG